MRDILETGYVSLIFRLPYDRDDIFARAFDMSAADCVVKPVSPTGSAARQCRLRAFRQQRRRCGFD